MARPEKNNADYFSHDTGMRNDLKVKALRWQFGSNGYAFWCMLLEVLANENNFEYEYNELNAHLLEADFEMKNVKEMIDYAITLKLIVHDEERGVIYSDGLKDRLSPLIQKRERDKEYRQQRRGQQRASKQKKEEVKKEVPKKETKKTTPKPVKEEDSFIVKGCMKVFEDKYFQHTKGVSYTWDKESKQDIVEISDKLVSIRKNAGVENIYDAKEISKSFEKMLDVALKDDYINNIFSTNILNKQFNQLSLKTSKAVEKIKSVQSAYEIEEEQAKRQKSEDLKMNIWGELKADYCKNNPDVDFIKVYRSWQVETTPTFEKLYTNKCAEMGLPIV